MTDNRLLSVSRVFKKAVASLNAIGTVWIFVMMLVITVDVVGRAVFKQPLVGAIEFIKVSLVGIVFLQIPDAFMKDKHIRSDVILGRVGLFYREIFNFFGSILGSLLFIGIIISSWQPTIAAWKIFESEGEGALRIPTYPIRTLIILSSVMALVFFLSRAVNNIKALIKIKER
jgi:TRAP-type C4-dicarboxylate transport system permease small subunit